MLHPSSERSREAIQVAADQAVSLLSLEKSWFLGTDLLIQEGEEGD